MGFIKGTIKSFRDDQVETIVMRNDAKTFIIGCRFTKFPNTLRDYWNLFVYEIHQGPIVIEYIGGGMLARKQPPSVGYLCDEIGTTISPERIQTTKSEKPAEEFNVSRSWLEDFEFKAQSVKVPFILISEGGSKWTVGGYIRKAGKILTNGIDPITRAPGPVYRINSEPVEIIDIRTGEKGIGYLCDESGQTVNIKRDVKAWKPDPIPKRKMSDGDECELRPIKIADSERIVIKGNFAGILGQIAGIDKIQDVFDFGNAMSTKIKFALIGGGLVAGLWFLFR